jgi:hypothetical protein
VPLTAFRDRLRKRPEGGLAVADDQLTLAPPDGGHGVDGLDAGLERLVHGLAAGDARSLDLHAAHLGVDHRALAVDGLTQGVDDATDEAVADGHREDAAGGSNHGALVDGRGCLGVTQHHGADGLFVEVESQAQRAALELEDLVDRRVGQARHSGDAFADLEHAPDLGLLDTRAEAIEVLLESGGDVAGGDRQFGHVGSLSCGVAIGFRTIRGVG